MLQPAAPKPKARPQRTRRDQLVRDTESERRDVLRVVGELRCAQNTNSGPVVESLWVPVDGETQVLGDQPASVVVALTGRDVLRDALPAMGSLARQAWVVGEAAWVLERGADALALHQLVRLDGQWRFTSRVSIGKGRHGRPVTRVALGPLAPAVGVVREFENAIDARRGGDLTHLLAPAQWVFSAVVSFPGDRDEGAEVGAAAAWGPHDVSAQHQLLWQLTPPRADRRLLGVWSLGSMVWVATGARIGGHSVTVVYQVAFLPRMGWRITSVLFVPGIPRAPADRALSLRAMARAVALPQSHWLLKPAGVAFVAGLLVYALTRFWRLGEYPIYFFTDEAVQVRHAEELLRRGLRGTDGIVLPMYFQNANTWGPFFPVYLHAVVLGLFGKSVELARGLAAVVTLSAAGALALALRLGLKSTAWWAAPLILATSPGWFLHSRTSFETVFAASFYAWFILFYVLYRTRAPRFLYPALVLLALTFYSYSNAQTVAAASGVALALIDARYHLRHWRHAVGGIALVVALAIPFLVFQRAHPATLEEQLTRVGSYWYYPLPTADKVRFFALEYWRGLSPERWFLPDPPELTRHRMLGYGHFRTWLLPFFVIGVVVCAARIRSPGHRVLLVALAAAPLGGALAQTAITRAMVVVVPVAALIVVGLEPLVSLLRWKPARSVVAVVAFLGLSGSSVHLLHDSLTNGPLWFRDYTLNGQQWGAKQIFDVAREYLAADPANRLILTSTWANGTDEFPLFFMDQRSPDARRVAMGDVRSYLSARLPLDRYTILIMTPEELALARASGRFSQVEIDRTLPYPDGSPGFHFARLAYADDFDVYLEADRTAKRALVDAQAVIDGEPIAIRHSPMDAGSLKDIFDGVPRTLGRFNASNPAVMELSFVRPRTIRSVRLLVSPGAWHAVVRVREADAPDYGPAFAASGQGPSQDVALEVQIAEGTPPVLALRVEMELVGAGDEAIIHLRELTIK